MVASAAEALNPAGFLETRAFPLTPNFTRPDTSDGTLYDSYTVLVLLLCR